MLVAYILLTFGIVETIALVVWVIRRQTIKKTGQFTEAQVQACKMITGRPNRYRFEIAFYDTTNQMHIHKIWVNGAAGKSYQRQGRIPVIYVESKDKVYLQKTPIREIVLGIVIIMVTFAFSFFICGGGIK